MKRTGAAGVVLIAAFVMTGGSASAVKLCVPEAQEREVLTLKHGKCKRGYKPTSLGVEGKEGKAGKPGAEGRPGPEGKTGPQGKLGPEGKMGPEGKAATTGFTSGELETLKGILPCIRSVKEGIGGKPTVQFSGCNVQIVNGEGKTASVNGEGNLVLGYDEHVVVCRLGATPPPCRFPGEEEELPYTQTGSHDLMLGNGNSFTSYGGIAGGEGNVVSGPSASALGGDFNTASGQYSATLGGDRNTVSGQYSATLGGDGNTASGGWSVVSGGFVNTASGEANSIQGGNLNKAEGSGGSISGGRFNTVGGNESWIGGGAFNSITGNEDAIFGGAELTTSALRAALPSCVAPGKAGELC